MMIVMLRMSQGFPDPPLYSSHPCPATWDAEDTDVGQEKWESTGKNKGSKTWKMKNPGVHCGGKNPEMIPRSYSAHYWKQEIHPAQQQMVKPVRKSTNGTVWLRTAGS